MLNQTSNLQVRRVIYRFFERWPTPESIVAEDPKIVSEEIKSLGFRNRRTETIQRFSSAWIKGGDPLKMPGIGKYAADSYKIFILNDRTVSPTDKILQAYLRGENIQPHRLDPRFIDS